MTSLRRFAAAARGATLPAAAVAAAVVMGGCSPESTVPTLTAPAPLPAPVGQAGSDPRPSTPETAATEAGTMARQVSVSAPEAAPALPEGSAQGSRVAFSLAAPSNVSGASEPGVSSPHESPPARPQPAEM